MVDVETQFLVGVAVTVYIALLFFGVVVLWEISLALRSVGDKIDKLEDNLDDDLTTIGHTIDGISDAGSGGTQLHLSGGTISSGPSPNRNRPSSPEAERTARRGAERDRTGRAPAAGPAHSHPTARGQRAATGTGAPESEPRDGTPAESDAGNETDDDTNADDERAADGTEASEDESSPADEATDDRVDAPTADASEPAPDDDEEPADDATPTPRAAANRGRFITSPDRTPWYLTPFDRDAVTGAEPEPDIAGELESPRRAASRREPDVIAAGPVSSDGAGPNDPRGDEASDDDADAPADLGGETDAESTARDGADEATGVREGDPDEDGGDRGAADRAGDGAEVLSYDDAVDAPDTGGERIGSASTDRASSQAADDAGADHADDGETDETGVDVANADGAPASDSTELPGGSTFEFDDIGTGAGEAEDVTVDEAVDEMNEEAPSLSLSSHEFDVTAEADDDGAVVLFEFDPRTATIGGSTERLLRYQMRSFADQESSPDADVTIDGQRIAIEIPEPDGNAVQRWGEAAVEIVDRTLYLSDNSE